MHRWGQNVKYRHQATDAYCTPGCVGDYVTCHGTTLSIECYVLLEQVFSVKACAAIAPYPSRLMYASLGILR